MKINWKNKLVQWSILILLSLIWGSSFILMKRGLESFNDTQVGAMRIFFTFLFLLPFAFKRIKNISKSDILSLLVVGFVGNFFPAFLFAKAQTEISSSLAGMLNSAFPVFAIIIGTLFYKTKVLKIQILGSFIAMIGAIGLILGNSDNIYSGNLYYSFFIIIAMVMYAISLNQIKYKLSHLDGVTITIISFMFTGPVAGGFLLFSDFSEAVSSPLYIESLIYIALLALLSSAVAVSMFYVLVEHVDPIFAASVTYIIPIVAILWGIIDGESISLIQFICMAIIIIGVYVVNKKKKDKPEKPLNTFQ